MRFLFFVWTPPTILISLLGATSTGGVVVVAAEENSKRLQQQQRQQQLVAAAASDAPLLLRIIGSSSSITQETVVKESTEELSNNQKNIHHHHRQLQQEDEVLPDYSCNLQSDTCPYKNNNICDSEVSGTLTDTRCANGDCEDCNFYCSDLFENDCVGCLKHGCYYCAGDGKCYNSPHYTTSRDTETGQSTTILINNPNGGDSNSNNSNNPYLAFGTPSCTSPEQFWFPPHRTSSETATTTTPDFITQTSTFIDEVEAICQPPEFVFRYVYV